MRQTFNEFLRFFAVPFFIIIIILSQFKHSIQVIIEFIFFSCCGRGIFCLLGTIPSTKTSGHLRKLQPGSHKRFDNRCKCLSSFDIRIGNSVLLVSNHKSASIQSHVAQVQNSFQSEYIIL